MSLEARVAEAMQQLWDSPEFDNATDEEIGAMIANTAIPVVLAAVTEAIKGLPVRNRRVGLTWDYGYRRCYDQADLLAAVAALGPQEGDQ